MIDKNSIKKEEQEPNEKRKTAAEEFRERVSLKGEKRNKFLTSKELYARKQAGKKRKEEGR